MHAGVDPHNLIRCRLMLCDMSYALFTQVHLFVRRRNIKCQALVFAPPACAAKSLAGECRDYVTSVVVADDIITRFSPAALARLHGSLADMSPEEIHEVQPQLLYLKEIGLHCSLADSSTEEMQHEVLHQ